MSTKPNLSSPDDESWKRQLEEHYLDVLRRKIADNEPLTPAEQMYVDLLKSYGRHL